MVRLPFLVVHGELIWKLLWVIVIAATLGLGVAIRRWRARRTSKRRFIELSNGLTSPQVGDDIAMVGKVIEGTATDSDDENALVLEIEKQRVIVVAPIRVEHGSRVVADMWKQTVTQTVVVGDELAVRGTMTAAPPTGEDNYREATPTWILTNATVVVPSNAARLMPYSLGKRVFAVVAVSLISLFALYTVGGHFAKEANHAAYQQQSIDGVLPEFGDAEIAAAMPFMHDEALDDISLELSGRDHPASERAYQLAMQVADLRTGPCAQHWVAARSVHLDDALRAAQKCMAGVGEPRRGEDPRAAAINYMAALGNFADAEKLVAPTDESKVATFVHIANGNWNAAAKGADAEAARLDHEEEPTQARGLFHKMAATRRCIAALFRTYGGTPDAFHDVPHDSTPCAILLALTTPAGRATLGELAERHPSDDADDAGYWMLARELAFTYGPPVDRYYSEGDSSLMFLHDRSRIWLAPFQAAAHVTDEYMPIAAESMTAYLVLRGDLAQAKQHLASVQPGQQHDDLAVAIQLRDGSPILAKPTGRFVAYTDGMTMRQGTVGTHLHTFLADERPFILASLQRAAAGDGNALVDALAGDYVTYDTLASSVLGVIPRIKTHRDEVKSALRFFRDHITIEMGSPFMIVGYAVEYRDSARLIGDTEEAQRWQALIDRYVAVFSDPQKLIAMLVWNE